MKRTLEDKAETRKLIVTTAAREFRKNGEKVGLTDIMNAAGLTHGGFYRHFASKDELFGESVAFALKKVGDRMEQCLKTHDGDSLEAIINLYLAPAHRDNHSNGCPLAALGSEMARAPKAVRAQVEAGYSRVVNIIASCLPKASETQRLADAQFILASMSGALTMARIMCDKEESERMLKDCVNRLVAAYA
jgi:TetR/AcrR family transcriptional repressor of nem operon